jgi:hypothetical protein
MTKDNQGSGKDQRTCPEIANPINAIIPQPERAIPQENHLLSIMRALMQSQHKCILARDGGHKDDHARLIEVCTSQRLQIMLAEPVTSLDAVVIASMAMRLANALPDIENQEGLRQVSAELQYALSTFRRIFEAHAGITSDALGLNGEDRLLQ